MPSRLAVFACLAVALALQLRPAAAEIDWFSYQARLKSEAILFFGDVLPQLDLGRAPCTISAEWYEYPVLAEWLDVTAHANLIPPHHGTQPAEILDPGGRETAWLCDQADVDALVLATTQRLASQPGAVRAELAGFELTFPIFSKDFDRAVIVLADWQIWLSRREGENQRLVGGHNGGGRALVYERRDGHWIRLNSHDLFAYEGVVTTFDLSGGKVIRRPVAASASR